MAKLGMPSVDIAFKEAGIEAIERSKRGIVALILEEDDALIKKLFTDHDYNKETVKAIAEPLVVYTTDDIPGELTDTNKDYITKAMLGYTKTPYRVKVWFQAKATAAAATEGGTTAASGDSAADKFAPTLKKMTTARWDYLAIPTIKTAQCESVGTWLKSNRENKGKR